MLCSAFVHVFVFLSLVDFLKLAFTKKQFEFICLAFYGSKLLSKADSRGENHHLRVKS